jgi:hypothetical protein
VPNTTESHDTPGVLHHREVDYRYRHTHSNLMNNGKQFAILSRLFYCCQEKWFDEKMRRNILYYCPFKKIYGS